MSKPWIMAGLLTVAVSGITAACEAGALQPARRPPSWRPARHPRAPRRPHPRPPPPRHPVRARDRPPRRHRRPRRLRHRSPRPRHGRSTSRSCSSTPSSTRPNGSSPWVSEARRCDRRFRRTLRVLERERPVDLGGRPRDRRSGRRTTRALQGHSSRTKGPRRFVERLTFNGSDDGQKVRIQHLIIARGKIGYFVTMFSNPGNEKADATLFLRMYNSFKPTSS